MKLWIFFLSGVILVYGFVLLPAGNPLKVGLQKQLLVDDYVIEQKQNIVRYLNKPKKYGIVMRPTLATDSLPGGQPPDGSSVTDVYYEFGRRLSVVWNEERQVFQMLYRAAGEGLTGYAESSDGISWTKPLISDDGLSNLITYRGKNRGTFYEASFMIDPTVPWGHLEKYKAAYNPGNTKCAIAHSNDGIHWVGYNNGKSVTGRAADTFNQILWDPIKKHYLLLTRTDLGEMGGLKESRAVRIMAHIGNNDLNAQPTAWKTLATINVDDPDHAQTSASVPVHQMESMNVWIYENVYFSLMHVLTVGSLTGSEGQVKVSNPDTRPDKDVIDYYIGTSRNSVDFDKSWIYSHQPFIIRGPAGSFDQAMLQPSSQIITRNDEHLIYYSGHYNQHHTPESAQKKTGKIGLAKVKLDRFIGQQAKDEVGSIITKPFILSGNNLEVNVDAKAGWIKVEILDAQGNEISNYCSVNAKLYKNVDDIHLRPLWEKSDNLKSLKGKEIRLRFTLKNAIVYAFVFIN